MEANRAFAPNCGCLYEVAILADDHQRDEAGQREIDAFDQLARLKENCSCFERDFSQVWFEKREPLAGGCPGGLRPLVRPNGLLTCPEGQ
jgi:hypothetical protein